MSEETILISILTAILAVLYLIAVRIGHVAKDIACMHDGLHQLYEEFKTTIDDEIHQVSLKQSDIESPFQDWDEG